MILPKGNKLTEAQLAEVSKIVEEFGCHIQVIVGAHRTLYAIIGDERSELMHNRLIGLDYVDAVQHMESAYRLMDIHSEMAGHRVHIGGTAVGNGRPYVIAGHCTIDPKEPALFLETAHAVKEAGADAIRGGVWKPRTNPHSYQGDRQALEILLRAREETGLPIDTEVMDEEHLKEAVEAKVDILQIGARNALNYSLLKQIGKATAGTGTAVLLKRGMHLGPIDEFLCAGEYIVAHGNPNLLLCPRGTAPKLYGFRNHPDESISALLKEKTWAPVVVDPSHSVGRSTYVPAACLAAVAYGADGLLIETHIRPSEGIGDDPRQAVTPEALGKLIADARALWGVGSRFRAVAG